MNRIVITCILALFFLTQYAMTPHCLVSFNSISDKENALIIEGRKVCNIKVVDYVRSKEIANSRWKNFNSQHDQNHAAFLIEIRPEKGWDFEEIKAPYYIEGDYATYYTIARMTKKGRCILISVPISQYIYTKFEQKKKDESISIILPFNSYLEFKYGLVTNGSLIYDNATLNKKAEYKNGLRVVSEYGTKGFRLWFLTNGDAGFFLSLSPDFIDFQYIKPILPIEVQTME